jgi:hypothetical protein
MDLGYCRPRKEIKAYYPRPCHYNLGATIGFKPTQRWHIIGHEENKWTLRRHNIVLELDDEEFINNFYRIEV